MLHLTRQLSQGCRRSILKSHKACLSTSSATLLPDRGRLDRPRPLENHEHAYLVADPEIVAWSDRREETTEDFAWSGKTFMQLAAFWSCPFLIAWAISNQEDKPAPFPYYTCPTCRLKHFCEHCDTIKKRCLAHSLEDEPRPVPIPQSEVFELTNPDGQKIVWDGYMRNNLNLYDPVPLIPKKGTDRECIDHWQYPEGVEPRGWWWQRKMQSGKLMTTQK